MTSVEKPKNMLNAIQLRQGTNLQQLQLKSRALEASSKDAQRCSPPTVPSCSCNSVAARHLGTLSPALTSSTYVLFKRHFKTKGRAKNLGGAFDHSQRGRSDMAFQFLPSQRIQPQ